MGFVACTFGRTAFVVVAGDDEPTAGLPVVEVHRRKSKLWLSLPLTDVCNVVHDAAVDPGAFLGEFDRFRQDAGVETAEVITDQADAVPSRASSPPIVAVTHQLHLDGSGARPLPSVLRNVRQALRHGIQVEEASSKEALDAFWRLHIETRHRQGVPVHPTVFKERLWSDVIEPGLGFVLLATHRGEVVAGAVFLQWHTTVVYKFGASRTAALHLRPNHALFGEAIERSRAAGMRCLHFGKSDLDNAGLRRFKESWGAVETPLFRIVLGRDQGPGALRRLAPALRPVIRHTPAFVGRAVGAAAYRYLQ